MLEPFVNLLKNRAPRKIGAEPIGLLTNLLFTETIAI